MKLKSKIASTLLATLLLAACGSGVSGTYTDSMGITSYTFESGGKVEVSTMGATMEMHYAVDGNKVKIALSGNADGPTQVLTIQPDGSIAGPGGIKLTKKK